MKILTSLIIIFSSSVAYAQSSKILSMYNCKTLTDAQTCNSNCSLDKNNRFSYRVDTNNSTITWFLFDKNNVLRASKTADFCKIFDSKNLVCNPEQTKLFNGDYSYWGVANGIYWSEFYAVLSESQKIHTFSCAK